MEFRVLGPLEVVDGGRVLDLGGRKQRALLAVLLLESNRQVSRDRLIDALWEDDPTSSAGKALQVYVSGLRKVLGRNRVLTTAGGYLLHVERGEVDLADFEQLYADGRHDDALALWRGAPLAEFAQQRFAQGEIARLEQRRLDCLEARIERDLAESRHAQLVGELEALVRLHPLRERFRELYLLALYRCGRQGDALAAYQDARTVLVGELGVEPRKQLRELHQSILRQDPGLEIVPDVDLEPDARVFVGRESELAELDGALNDAIAGRGRLVLLVGEPGIGKTRVAEKLIESARARGARVRVGRCWEASGAPAFWPWVHALRSGAEGAPPELASLLRGEPISSESESARFRLFDMVAGFLRSSSDEQPLVLFLDDMHAADEPSLLLLQFAAREIATAHVLIVAAFRDLDPLPGRELVSTLADLASEPVTTRISLHGLAEEDVAAFLALAAADLASADLTAELVEETNGNPLFVAETVRLLTLEGRITMPESVRDVIARRLAHLSVETSSLLAAASVLGREFELDVLARMTDLTVDALLDALDEASAARIVAGAPGGFRFDHMLIRDVLYEGLTAPRRIRLHRLAIDALEEVHTSDSGAHLAELAHHATAGNDFGRALEWAKAAGHRALNLLAYEEAARLYRAAFDALEHARPDDDATRCELLISLGEAESRIGNSAGTREACLAAASIARRLRLPHQLARAAAGYGDAGRILWARAGDDSRLVPLLEEGLGAVGEDVALRSRLLARLAGALRDEFDRARRDALSREAVEIARTTGNGAVLGYALVGRAHAITAPDTVAEFMSLADELQSVAVVIDDKERIAASRLLRVMGQHALGEMAGARMDLEAAARIAQELRQPSHLWEVGGVRAMLALAEGRFDEADALIDEVFALGETAMPEAATTHRWMQRALFCEFRGGLEHVEPQIAVLAAEHQARPVLACALAYVRAQIGSVAEAARALAEHVHTDGLRVPFDQEWPLAVALLSETAALLDDASSAATLYEALLPWEGLNMIDQSEGCRGSAARYLGLLATVLGRLDEAENHFQRALAANERMGLQPWVARTRQDYARLLRLRGQHRAAAPA
jgi:DNA-binding SARP family transcriptional activator/tetratricopeptide (TPR) repeat protein